MSNVDEVIAELIAINYLSVIISINYLSFISFHCFAKALKQPTRNLGLPIVRPSVCVCVS